MQHAEHFHKFFCACRPETMKKNLSGKDMMVFQLLPARWCNLHAAHTDWHTEQPLHNTEWHSTMFPLPGFSMTFHTGITWWWYPVLCLLILFYLHSFFFTGVGGRESSFIICWCEWLEKASSFPRERSVWVIVLMPAVNYGGCNEIKLAAAPLKGYTKPYLGQINAARLDCWALLVSCGSSEVQSDFWISPPAGRRSDPWAVKSFTPGLIIHIQ